MNQQKPFEKDQRYKNLETLTTAYTDLAAENVQLREILLKMREFLRSVTDDPRSLTAQAMKAKELLNLRP